MSSDEQEGVSGARACGELAFEHEFSEPPPAVLYRVVSIRTFHEREIRHVNWFCGEVSARAHAAWINDGRGIVMSIACYRLSEILGQ